MPKQHDGPLPAVFFHSGGGSGENTARTGFREMVAREGFLAVYPRRACSTAFAVSQKAV